MTGAARKDMIDTVERGDALLADRAYDSNALRQTLATRGATANKADAKSRRRPAIQPPALSQAQSGRTVLQQNQALSNRRQPLRQT
jgi:hypothetical protein